MAATAKVQINKKEFENFKDQVAKVSGQMDVDTFIRSCSKELAARLLAKVIKRTPVHDYTKDEDVHFVTSKGKEVHFHSDVGHYKMGGTLRRGWTAKTHEEAEKGTGNGKDAQVWANSLAITKAGGVYTINVVNPVEYAPYVEFGHRGRGGKGWVDGQFFLTISENELRQSADAILQAKLEKYLKGMVK